MNTDQSKPDPRVGKIRPIARAVVDLFRYLATLATAVFVIFVGLNLVAHFLLPKDRGNPIEKYGLPLLMQAYPGWTEMEVRRLIEESYGTRASLEYHPFAAFRSSRRSGKYLNVEEGGFRQAADRQPWPPPVDSYPVFLFGGSTAFGLGVTDGETISVAMQRALRRTNPSKQVLVYNFGVPAYFSSQELALFNDLLRDGRVPKIAVFLDGMNDFAHSDGRPEFFHALSYLMNANSDLDALFRLPLVQWVQGRRWRKLINPLEDALDPGQAREAAQRVIDRWGRNARSIQALAGAFGVRTAFVWQPLPTYKYDLKNHLFMKEGKYSFGVHRLSAVGYREAEEQKGKTMLGKALWLADIQESRNENLYVDQVHYSPKFSAEIGERIAAYLGKMGVFE